MRNRFIIFLLGLLIAAGCAAPPAKERPLIFYPLPPEPARVQFLTSFSGTVNFEKPRTGFDAYVLGNEAPMKLTKPYGAAIYDGKIYVCDTGGEVVVFNLEKRTIESLKGGQGLGKLLQPINISVDADGNKYVTDPIRGQVVVYNKNDEYSRAYGFAKAWKPVDAAVYEDRVYIADNGNRVVQVLDKATGKLLKTIGSKGGQKEDALLMPLGVTFDREGYLYVTDGARFQVVKFDRDGHYIAGLGKLGTNIGNFGRPRSTAIDRDGRIYAVDASFNNVQVFNKDRYFLLVVGQGGNRPGDLGLPAKVVIDYDNLKYFESYIDPNFNAEYLMLVTSQFGDNMVSVFAFGKEKGKQYLTDEELLEQAKKKPLDFKQDEVKGEDKEGEAK